MNSPDNQAEAAETTTPTVVRRMLGYAASLLDEAAELLRTDGDIMPTILKLLAVTDGIINCAEWFAGVLEDRECVHTFRPSVMEQDAAAARVRGKIIIHTKKCIHNRVKLQADRLEWESRFPNHCRECGGNGGSVEYPCSLCLGMGRCPRCRNKVQYNEEARVVQCRSCLWVIGEPGKPAGDACICSEDLPTELIEQSQDLPIVIGNMAYRERVEHAE